MGLYIFISFVFGERLSIKDKFGLVIEDILWLVLRVSLFFWKVVFRGLGVIVFVFIFLVLIIVVVGIKCLGFFSLFVVNMSVCLLFKGFYEIFLVGSLSVVGVVINFYCFVSVVFSIDFG